MPEPADARPSSISHHDLATTVRRLKGFVLASIAFGPIAAPFAIYIASQALVRHAQSGSRDAAIHRQLVLLRRIATGLLIAWALLLGARVAMWRGGF